MPGFAWRLSNEEVAQLLSFIRNSWGNKASAVTADDVGKIRGAMDRDAAANKRSGT